MNLRQQAAEKVDSNTSEAKPLLNSKTLTQR
jgi:hypothetical protein